MPTIENDEGIELEPLRDVRDRVGGLRQAGYENDKIDGAIRLIGDIDANVKSMKVDPRVADVEAKVAVVGGAVESISDLVTTVQGGGDNIDIADKAVSVVNSIAQFGALAGPEGEIVAVVATGITSLVSMCLGLAKPKEKSPLQKMQDAITDLIDKKFAEQEFKDLKEEATEEMSVLKENSLMLTDTLSKFASLGSDFDEATKLSIANVRHDHGIGIMGSLRQYIEAHLIPSTRDEGMRVAHALLLYSLVAQQRALELICLGGCYMWKNWSTPQRDILLPAQQRVATDCEQVLGLVPFFGVPGVTADKKFRFFHAGLYALGNKNVAVIKKNCAPHDSRTIMGRTVAIVAKYANNGQLLCYPSTEERAAATTKMNADASWIVARFVVFDLRPMYPDDFVRIFSIGACGYLFGSDASKTKYGFRRVMAWTSGESVSNGHWKIANDVLTNTKYSQVINSVEGEAYLDTYVSTANVISDFNSEWVISNCDS